MGVQSERPDTEFDIESLADTIREYPVRCAILYGSHVHGTSTGDSDVDIAVAFDRTLSEADRLDHRVALTATLMEALGRDRVDVADLDEMRPEVGLQAVETGYLLVGEQHVLDEYRTQFEREATSRTHEQRMEQFDAILGRLEERV